MVSIGLVANNYTVVDPNNVSDSGNISFTNSLFNYDKDIHVNSVYTNITSIPDTVVPTAGIIKSNLNSIQAQLDNIQNIPNLVNVVDLGNNMYTIQSTVHSQVVSLLKVKRY